jgi:uncharacterized protein (TIGR00730 family)
MAINSICVYCGSSDLVDHKFLDSATLMGKEIAERGMRLIYGGGSTGLMGAVADNALAHNGEVIGVIPEHLNKKELAHFGVTRLEVVDDMHQRKARMIELADAFIALPGGFGTLEELFEALTWSQLGLHGKAIGLLNVDGYYDALLKFLEHANKEGFTYNEHQGLYRASEDGSDLIEALLAYERPDGLEKWLDR